MDLQSGNFYWPTTYPDPITFPSLTEDIRCDVLIVGGGSSGAQCAYELADTGLDVVLIDKGRFASGSTASNTAIIQYAGEKSFVSLKNSFGEDQAVQHMKLCEAAINDIGVICDKLPVSTEFIRRDSLYYASKEEDVAGLKEELVLLQKHGFKVDYWSEDQVRSKFPFSTHGALYYYNDAELNPYKYTHGMLQSAHSRGVRLYEHTEWSGHKQEEDSITLYTKDRRSIRAQHVIFAGGYANQDYKRDKNAVITSSYNLVTSPVADLSSWTDRTLIWETARPYIYLRTTPDNRIIIGGLDESTYIAEERDRHLLSKKDQLMLELSRRFPEIKAEAEFSLAAFYGGTHDGLPILGIYDEFPRCIFLNAYGDNGLVYSMVLARILRDMLTTGSSPASGLYLQTRPTLTSASH